MYFSMQLLSTLCFVITVSTQATFERSSKRGLVFAPSSTFPQDDQIWVQPSSDLTWYYNYMWQPSPQFASLPQSKFEFIPMIWGAPSSPADFQFLNNVTELIQGGRNITHVLAFNEPDGPWSQGGSNMTVSAAAQGWQQEIVPLQKLGIKAGAPVVTQRGLSWLQDFSAACQNCTLDFIPLHYYGNFSGLVDYINEVHTAYPNAKLWITEYAYDHTTLQQSQDFFNSSATLFDSTDYIERYSYFGAFRSNNSNVGPNAAFLTAGGKLTSIGSWYLGGAETSNIPSAASTVRRGGMNIGVMSIVSLIVGWIGTTGFMI